MSDSTHLAEHLFRQKSGEILASLLRTFGYDAFDRVEEAVQTAFQKALEHWPYSGIPENPGGWLYRVARRAVLESIRQETRRGDREWRYAATQEAAADTDLPPAEERDDAVVMLLLCCNGEVSAKAQACFTLKAVCGFGIAEISRAVGMAPEAVKKAIARAKHRMGMDADRLLDVDEQRIQARFVVVLETLYALFSEGYAATRGETQLRKDIAGEAIRLVRLLGSSTFTPPAHRGDVRALLALMLLQMARFDAREVEGEIPRRLQDQDRSRWNREMILEGLAHLSASMAESRPSSYHIEARIAASHATSPSFDATDWPRILSLYDQLLLEKDTPEVRLNRIMAIHFAVGPEPALSALDAAFAEKSRRGFMYEAVHADLLLALGDRPGALEGWRRASRLAPTGGDRRFVQKKLEEVARGDVPRGPSPAS